MPHSIVLPHDAAETSKICQAPCEVRPGTTGDAVADTVHCDNEVALQCRLCGPGDDSGPYFLCGNCTHTRACRRCNRPADREEYRLDSDLSVGTSISEPEMLCGSEVAVAAPSGWLRCLPGLHDAHVAAIGRSEGAPHCIGVGQQELNPCTTCEPMMDCLREMTVLGADRADTVHCDNDGPSSPSPW